MQEELEELDKTDKVSAALQEYVLEENFTNSNITFRHFMLSSSCLKSIFCGGFTVSYWLHC